MLEVAANGLGKTRISWDVIGNICRHNNTGEEMKAALMPPWEGSEIRW